MNLAIQDVKVLFEGLDSHYNSGSDSLLETYSDRALERVWKAQQFSFRMTTMLPTGADDFTRARQFGELHAVVVSRHGMAYLAEAYTGGPGV